MTDQINPQQPSYGEPIEQGRQPEPTSQQPQPEPEPGLESIEEEE